MLRRRGGDIGGKTVTFIGWDRVWMPTGSQLCQSQMFKAAGRAERGGRDPAGARAARRQGRSLGGV